MLKTRHLALAITLTACARPPEPPAALDPDLARLPLPARLAREAQSRPTGTPRLEEVIAALTRNGLAVERVQQVLGSTIGASFCASAATRQGTGVAVCEFASEDIARRGMSYSRQIFDRLIPGRTLALNHKTLLTVTRARAEGDGEAQTALSVFARL
jgi:hypothetical protein